MKVVVGGVFRSQFVCPSVGSITRFVTPGVSEALQVQLVVIPDCGCLRWHSLALSRECQLWRGLLLRTAWASNSYDKCSSHGDGGRFSQTNNGRMFICGRPHLGRSACLPLSLDRGIAVFVLAFPQWFICLSLSSLILYFFVLFSGLQCCVLRPTAQHICLNEPCVLHLAPAKSVSPAA